MLDAAMMLETRAKVMADLSLEIHELGAKFIPAAWQSVGFAENIVIEDEGENGVFIKFSDAGNLCTLGANSIVQVVSFSGKSIELPLHEALALLLLLAFKYLCHGNPPIFNGPDQ